MNFLVDLIKVSDLIRISASVGDSAHFIVKVIKVFKPFRRLKGLVSTADGDSSTRVSYVDILTDGSA